MKFISSYELLNNCPIKILKYSYNIFKTICLMAFDGIIVYTVAYSMLAICVVAPPTEFVSAGFTIQNLFSNFLGSEQMNFVGYHIRRTTVTLLVHALIPIGEEIVMIRNN